MSEYTEAANQVHRAAAVGGRDGPSSGLAAPLGFCRGSWMGRHMRRFPAGNRVFPEGRAGSDVINAFVRGQAGEGSCAVVRVVALGGTIGRDHLDRSAVEHGAKDSARGSGVEFTRFDCRQPAR